MSEFFLSVVNMSISASWIVLAVLLVRLFLKRAPKWITVLLWAVVAVRLILPISVKSEVSLLPSAQTIDPAITTGITPQIRTGISTFNSAVNPVIEQAFVVAPKESADQLQTWLTVATTVWGIGVVVMVVYGAVSYYRIKRKIGTAVLLQDRVYQSENVASSFVLGLIRPKIYLPFHIDKQVVPHVLAHEQAHIQRRDHWWKPLGFALLALHWFNPLMWLGYIFLCRDIELACDEKVVKRLDTVQRADYSQALLNCSVNRRAIAMCPLAFGEVSVKDRVKSVLHYRKPAFWMILLALTASIVIAVCFLTDPASVMPEKSASIHESSDFEYLINIENLTLRELTEETILVDLGDSPCHKAEKEWVQALSELKISREAISNNRKENRDKTNAFTIFEMEDADYEGSMSLRGLSIYFDADFTSVWVDSWSEITLSYEVLDPQKAKEIYESIANIPVVTRADVYPMYYGLDVSKGLQVYIWQMAEYSYSCGLLPGKDAPYTYEEIWNLHKNPVPISTMRYIIKDYMETRGLAKEDITIYPISMPHSSYAYTIDEAYKQALVEKFWSSLPFEPLTITQANFDIDGDQKTEECVVTYGPPTGIFTFCVYAIENGAIEYHNYFSAPHMLLEFETASDGQTVLVGRGAGTRYMTLGVENGNIVIYSDEQDIVRFGVCTIKTIDGNLKTYYQLSDGRWKYQNHLYKYRLEITGRQPMAVADTTYIYLSNLESISFEKAMMASGLSSSLNDYFPIEEAVLVEIRTQ